MFNIPILLIVYIRKDSLFQILNELKKINPEKLYIALDYPPIGNADAIKKNAEVKHLIDTYPFPENCMVFKNISLQNLGPGNGPKSAIDWFFQQESQGIILEDDCLPNLTFFDFCRTLLIKYADDDKIMSISGNNYLQGAIEMPDSYYFTKYPNIWGWASWRRAWLKMDWSMANYIDFLKQDKLSKYTNTTTEYWFWKKTFNHVYNQSVQYWDYQWLYSIWNNDGYGIAPSVNLVKNIGFDENATHTLNKPIWYNQLIHGEISHIKHPINYAINKSADDFLFNNCIAPPPKKLNLFQKILTKLSSIIKPKSNKTWEQDEYFDPIWKERIRHMSVYIQPTDSVVDLGCGMMWLRDFLKTTNIYFPVDYKKRDSSTIICNFNKEEFPAIQADIYFMSGCLEYIDNPNEFIKNISNYTNKCIVSYCSVELFSDLEVRKNLMWKNHLSNKELISLFEKHLFKLEDYQTTETNNQIFFFCK